MNEEMLKNMGIALEDQLAAGLKEHIVDLMRMLLMGPKSQEDISLLFDCAKFTIVTLTKREAELRELEQG